MVFPAGQRNRSRCTAVIGAKKKALPLWKRQSQKKHFLQSRQPVVEQKIKNSWGDAAESRLETSCGSLWIKWLSAAKKRNAARSGMPFSFRKHLFCSKKHYIEKRPDCQANFNFSRNMRKNKRVFCQISMKRRRSAGVRARSSASARSSSCSPRNPQTQPMVCTPAFLPV